MIINMISVQYDALPLEYKLENWRTGGNGNVLNGVDQPAAERVCRIFGLGLAEEPLDLGALQRGFLTDYTSDSFVVGLDRS